MKTKLTLIVSALAMIVLLFSSTVTASTLFLANENSKASDNSQAMSLSQDIERIDFIHYKKPKTLDAGTSGSVSKAAACYKLLGGKWGTLPVNYVINPANPQNLSASFVTSAVSRAAETWDASASKELFNNAFTIDYNEKYLNMNGKNAIVFGDYGSNNVIAVTSVWITRTGKNIVEFDILFNTRYIWGDASTSSSVMDLQEIAAHELGHGVGLADIYSTSCSTVTMYGYSGYGETIKRTLESPDITGLQQMYGR